MSHKASILVVDDDEENLKLFVFLLRTAGYAVTPARDGVEAIRLLDRQNFELVLTDMLMPNADGVEVLAHLRRRPVRPPVIAMSGGGTHLAASQMLALATQLGAIATLTKPFTREQLLAAIEAALCQAGG